MTFLFTNLLATFLPFLAPAAAAPGELTTLSVVVTNLPSDRATLKLYFYNEPASFLVRNRYTLLKYVKPAGRRQLTYSVQVPPGEWAIALTQDLNENDLVDRNIVGLPTEPFALSNNFKPRFKIPVFADCKFSVSGRATTVGIAMK